jgi:hypothetical protein
VINYFIGRDLAWLVARLGEAQTELASVSSLLEASAGDASSKQMTAKKSEIETLIERLLRQLNALDPVTYPTADIARVRLTVARFNDWP